MILFVNKIVFYSPYLAERYFNTCFDGNFFEQILDNCRYTVNNSYFLINRFVAGHPYMIEL